MTGFVYKEYKQNRPLLISTVLIPFAVYMLPLFLMLGMAETEHSENDQVLFILTAYVGYIALAMIQSLVFRGDDTKKWGYFIASSPEGIKGYLYTKYMMVLGMGLFFSFFMAVAGMVSGTIYESVYHESVLFINLPYMILFPAQLIFVSIDIPFIVRFGVKMGSIIKTVAVISFVLVFTVAFVISPAAVVNTFDSIGKIFSGESSGLIFTSIFPYLSFVLFYLSYKISSMIYMKGVENYAK